MSAVVRLEPWVLSVLRGVGAEELLEGNFQVRLEEVVIAAQRIPQSALRSSHR